MLFHMAVQCWSQDMLSCLPHTIFTAVPWVHSISCSSGNNVLPALKAALTVNLLSTDLPEQPELVLGSLPALAACRPINVFYLQGSCSELEGSTRDYLLCLSYTTRGSCYLIMSSGGSCTSQRLVRQLEIPVPVPGQCCSWVCTKSPCTLHRSFTDCCQSTYTPPCCSVTTQLPCIVPPSYWSSLGEPSHFNTGGTNRQDDFRDELVRNRDSEAPSPPPSSPTIDERNASNSPEVKLKSKRQRPPWRMSHCSSLPVPQISASPNHSSLFHSLPDAKAGKMNIGDVFGKASFKPRPPAHRQSFSASEATLIPS
ncbi:hypothetical protein XENOCAPTIV_028167 [Xenoophorus captivus]|uniref:Uncharacterized protein n=1 Tax=Xenoophorus captivus TaxID=1517983 RepID=A0ABV0RVM4_9TELE